MSKTPLAEHTLAIGEVGLTYVRGGRGPTLLYLHGEDGLAGHGGVLASLAERFDVIAPTLPGFDAAPAPRWLDSVDDYTHLCLAALDRLGVRGAPVVGFSLGAWIAAEMATKGGRFGALALVAPIGVKTGPVDRLDIPDIFAMRDAPLRELLYHDAEKGKVDPAASEAALTAIAGNREKFAQVAWEPWMHNPKLARRLGLLDIPTLVLRGDSDRMVTRDYAEAYAKLIAGARMQTIPAAGHFPHVEAPAALAASIIDFAAR